MSFTLPLVDFEIPLSVVVVGVVIGLTYSLIAVGLTLVYRTTRVLNLAAGEIGAFPALLVPWLVLRNGWPYWVAIPLALLVAVSIGGLSEFLVIRRLASAPRLTVLVATIGLGQTLFAFGILLPSAGQLTGQSYPTPFTYIVRIGDVTLTSGQLMILVLAPLVVVALTVFLRKSRIGRASRAAAENSEAARLAGIPIQRISLVIWVIAGLLAGIAAILIGPTRPLVISQALGPTLLLRALGAAMLGGLASLWGSFAGGVMIGVIEALVIWNYPTGGMLDLAIGLIIVASLLVRRNLGRALRGRDASGWTFARSVRPLAPDIARHPRVRAARWAMLTVLAAVAVLAPSVLPASNQFMLSSVVLFALMGLSLVVLTGYAGHVSLGQYAFVALGAAIGGRMLQNDIAYVPAAAIAVVVGCLVAVIVGLPALRVRGLFLAVTTLAFAVVTSTWLFGQSWFVTSRIETGSSLKMERPTILGVNFDVEQNYYWLCLGVLVVVSTMVYALRRSGLGRAMIAVRDNESCAMAMTLAPWRVKLVAFVIAGGIATLAGFLLGGLVITFSDNPQDAFGAGQSLNLVVTSVFGGVTTITGVVLGAAWVEGIPRILGDGYALLSSGFALIVILVLLPGGLASVVFDVRDRTVRVLVRARPGDTRASSEHVEPQRPALAEFTATTTGATSGSSRPLVAEHVTVKFGGLRALDDVSIHAERGEIVGLMGPNGAGKTTLFDVLSGMVRPESGQVLLDDRDITGMVSHRRARLGLGRTHQQALLFGDLTLHECIQVSLERSQPTRSLPTLVGWPGAIIGERRRAARADEIIELMDLREYTHQPVVQLPTGIRRLAELGCVVGLGAHVLLLDEPTAGFTAREVQSFGRIIQGVRDYLGATMFVIDHDVVMMSSLVERLYVLDAGRVIAEGPPSILESDDQVADAYLGTRLPVTTSRRPVATT